jgi:signal transduction histidine kinase
MLCFEFWIASAEEEEKVPELLRRKLNQGRPISRIFLWVLLGVFNAVLWLLLLAFHWEVSLRVREVRYWGHQLFPIQEQIVPLPVIYVACTLLTIASAGAILRDRSSLAARERIRALLFQILESLEIGVVVLDERDRLAMANDSARKLLPEIPPGYASLDMMEALKHRPGLRDLVKSATRQGEYVREVEYDLGTPGDSWPARITTLPLKNPQKRTTGTLLLVHDIRDVVRLERQMRTAERLSSLGTLAAAMAHEIRNPLEALDLNLALLERSLEADKPSADAGEGPGRYMKVLETEISRLAAIVDNFLSFARPSSVPMTEVRLDDILRQLADLLTNQAESRRIKLDLQVAGLPAVHGSEDQLKQVFLNLAINSLEAMPDGGLLRIRAETTAGEDSSGRGDSLITVTIQDTGVGIPADQIPRLFDPYFTTRPKGTGLGLTIVHRVIHEHRGSIRVASVPGKGTTFTVELPLLAPAGNREVAAHV